MKQNTYEVIKRYFRRTYKNKLCALALIIIGVIATNIDNDATVLAFTLLIGLPLFFAKRNHIC